MEFTFTNNEVAYGLMGLFCIGCWLGLSLGIYIGKKFNKRFKDTRI